MDKPGCRRTAEKIVQPGLQTVTPHVNIRNYFCFFLFFLELFFWGCTIHTIYVPCSFCRAKREILLRTFSKKLNIFILFLVYFGHFTHISSNDMSNILICQIVRQFIILTKLMFNRKLWLNMHYAYCIRELWYQYMW